MDVPVNDSDQTPESAIGSAKTNNAVQAPIQFPSNIGTDENRHYTRFEIIETDRARDSTETVKSNHFIVLPLPMKIGNGFAANWDSLNMSSLGNLSYDLGKAYVRNNPTLGLAQGGLNIGAALDKIYKTSSMASIGNAVLGFALRGIISASPLAADAAAGANLGARNYVAQQFNGMGLREFTLNWKLIAKTQQETQTLYNMELALKKAMHPELIKNDFLISYPNKFKVRFYSTPPGSGSNSINTASGQTSDSGQSPTDSSGDTAEVNENPYLPRYKDCVLLSVLFDYNESGVQSFHIGTDAPLEVSVSLAFREADLNYRGDFDSGVVR